MSDLKQRLAAAVSDDLAAIEQALGEHLQSQVALVGQVAGHLLYAGGKRLRPLLMITAARLCGYSGDRAARTAVIFEYMHAASLLHDDVVDGGELRRGRTAAHRRWDTPTAVLTGDFLLARSLTLATETELPAVVRTIAAIAEQMAQGEIRQLARKGDPTLSEEEYHEVIRCKTAVLFEGAGRVGALLAAGTPPQVQALGDFGRHLGMAFQMVDDLLDYTQTGTVLGKQPGADLREGKLTLPLIHALQAAAAGERSWMEGLIRGAACTPADFERLRGLLTRYGSLAYTRRCARTHITTARRRLDVFAPSAVRATLADVAEYAVARIN